MTIFRDLEKYQSSFEHAIPQKLIEAVLLQYIPGFKQWLFDQQKEKAWQSHESDYMKRGRKGGCGKVVSLRRCPSSE